MTLAEKSPRVSLGMPVYNAEEYLEEALDSLLGQTFDDFELVISDNASTDRTEEICRKYAAQDERIRYFRYRANYGVFHNFRTVFKLSGGEYFKWCASDDVCAPNYLRRAVDVLDRDPSVVLVFPLVVGIDEKGRRTRVPGQITDRDSSDSVSSSDPVTRFRKLIRNIWWVDAAFYGVMRAGALAHTSVHPEHMNGDQILLTELCFKGRFSEIPEEMFFSRVHANKTTFRQKTLRHRAELIENRPLGRGIPSWWKMLRHYPQRVVMYTSVVRQADLSRMQRTACYYEIARSLAWWMRLRLHRFLARWRDIPWLRPNYPPSDKG
jgi:glycosyltransferase involved in cell wall biosynthesis